MMRRRLILAGMAAGVAGMPFAAWAQRRPPAPGPLRVGAERLLVDTGLADTLRRSFAADTGLALTVTAGPSSGLLEALERGEFDAAITHAPALEKNLEHAGLTHDRRPVAHSDFLIVGPSEHGRDPAGVAGLRDAAAALARIAGTGAAFLTLADGSGTHLAEQALWRAAGVAPAAPWYRHADAAAPLFAQAQTAGAYTVLDRASWLRGGRRPKAGALRLLVEGDARLATEFHVQRSFRIHHPAARLFVAWVAGARGGRTVARVAGFRAPPSR